MKRTAVILLVLTSCARESSPAPAPAPTPPAVATAPSPIETLNQMDQRASVPLLPMMANHQKQNMREHLVAVQEIVAGLVAEDFAAIEKAAGRVGFSEQMGQMCNHMGAGAPGFTEQALTFHHTADRIAEAARKHDRAQVLTELNATLQTCTACHAAWKQEVVDEQAWTRLTRSAAPAGSGHPH